MAKRTSTTTFTKRLLDENRKKNKSFMLFFSPPFVCMNVWHYFFGSSFFFCLFISIWVKIGMKTEKNKSFKTVIWKWAKIGMNTEKTKKGGPVQLVTKSVPPYDFPKSRFNFYNSKELKNLKSRASGMNYVLCRRLRGKSLKKKSKYI